MPSFGMLRRVALVRTNVSEERSASIIRVTRIGELGTTLTVIATDARCEEVLCPCAYVPQWQDGPSIGFPFLRLLRFTRLRRVYPK
jgi:hypothetical protein